MHRRAASSHGHRPQRATASAASGLVVTVTTLITVLVTVLVAALLVLSPLTLSPGAAAHAATDPEPPPVTVNEFLPEDRNLSDCVGALERPGCGSKARGGWRQGLVFVAVAAGLGVVFARVAWSSRNRHSKT